MNVQTCYICGDPVDTRMTSANCMCRKVRRNKVRKVNRGKMTQLKKHMTGLRNCQPEVTPLLCQIQVGCDVLKVTAHSESVFPPVKFAED